MNFSFKDTLGHKLNKILQVNSDNKGLIETIPDFYYCPICRKFFTCVVKELSVEAIPF